MNDEFSDRHQAIKMRLAGQSIADICRILNRSREWFCTWWQRYRSEGISGLYDADRRSAQPRRISAELERIIVNLRQRLESPRYAHTRYGLVGASAIQAELRQLQVRPLPSTRTIERVLQRNGLSVPRVRLARLISTQSYPTPQADESNDLHQVDIVGPIYLKGKPKRLYIFVCRDVFDGAVCLRLAYSRRMNDMLCFLSECWKSLGKPRLLQLDNAREFAGWGPSAKSLCRVIRICLRFGVEPVFIPPAQPQRNGRVENFNGWFQVRLLQRHFSTAKALIIELQRLQDVVNSSHPQRRLGGLTPLQYRRRRTLQKLPARFDFPTELLPIAVGRVSFIRQVTRHGNISLLGLTFKIGKRLKGSFVRATIDTQRRLITIYLNGRIHKRCPYPYLSN